MVSCLGHGTSRKKGYPSYLSIFIIPKDESFLPPVLPSEIEPEILLFYVRDNGSYVIIVTDFGLTMVRIVSRPICPTHPRKL